MRASLLTLILLSACSPSPPPPAADGKAGSDAARSDPPTEPAADRKADPKAVRIEPRTESMQNAATVGHGKERCPLFVHPWAASAPGCTINVTHCEADGAEQRCMALADERRVACGAKENICGEDVVCACPKGAARPVDDPPGTVKLRAGGEGAAWKSPGCRAVEVSELPRIGKPPFPACMVLIHDCDEGQACDERQYTLSCGIRSDVCGRRVHCACP